MKYIFLATTHLFNSYISRRKIKRLISGFGWVIYPKEGKRQSKSIPMSWNQNLCICLRQKKHFNSFEITVIILSYKKCKSPILKRFWKCRTSNQKSITLYFTVHPRNGTGKKQSRRQKIIRHVSNKKWSKKVAIAEVRLNWLYIQSHRWFNRYDKNFLTGFMISLFHAAHNPREHRVWNLMYTLI